MPHLQLRVLLILGVLLGTLSLIQAASYTFTRLDFPDATTTSSFAINDRSQIVGYGTGENEGL